MGIAARIRRAGPLVLAALLGAACSAPPLRIRAGDGSTTPDGLERAEAPGVGAAWVRSGVPFSRYDAVLIDPVSVAYAGSPRRPAVSDEAPGNYSLDPEGMERLRSIVAFALERELVRNEAFALADEPGPAVLRISAHVVDLVWEAPPVQGAETSYVIRTGEMTLVVEIRDSLTRQPLARIADRQAIRPVGASLGGGFKNQPVNNWAGVRDVADTWAQMVRQALDALLLGPEGAR